MMNQSFTLSVMLQAHGINFVMVGHTNPSNSDKQNGDGCGLVCACVCACVRACVRACLRACVRA